VPRFIFKLELYKKIFMIIIFCYSFFTCKVFCAAVKKKCGVISLINCAAETSIKEALLRSVACMLKPTNSMSFSIPLSMACFLIYERKNIKGNQWLEGAEKKLWLIDGLYE
jgi:hypothetical protein